MEDDEFFFFLSFFFNNNVHLSHLGYNQKVNKMYKCSLIEFFLSSLDRMIDADGVTGNALELNKENTVSKK